MADENSNEVSPLVNDPNLPSPSPALEPRQKLLEAAEVVFANRGYDGATIRDICDLAGMNIAAVNYHFGDKKRLYMEAVKHAHACSSEGSQLPVWEPGTRPADKLRVFVRTMLRQMHGPVRASSLQLMMREMANPSPAAEAVVAQFVKPMAHGLYAIVTELFPTAPEKTRLMIAFSVVGQCLFYRQNRKVSELLFDKERIETLDLESVTEHVTRFTLAALGHAEPYRS